MQSNKDVHGLAVFSRESQIRERSLKVYTYLICHSQLVDDPKFGDRRRVFQQKDINLSQMGKILKMDERTIKKYWEQLEEDGILYFNASGNRWEEDRKLSFNERWKVRRKHKETYYHINYRSGEYFRKIPKETLIALNETYQVKELVLKIYIILTNYQEYCIYNGDKTKCFTYKDLRDVLDYTSQAKINKDLEAALLKLQSYNLIDIEPGLYTHPNGWKIPVFILKQVNWYIDYNIKDFETGDSIWTDEIKAELRKQSKELYKEYF